MNEKYYKRIKKEDEKNIIKELIFENTKEMTAYILVACIIIGQAISYYFLFVFNDYIHIEIYTLGYYTPVIVYGFISVSTTMMLFFFSIFGIYCYQKSGSLNNDRK